VKPSYDAPALHVQLLDTADVVHGVVSQGRSLQELLPMLPDSSRAGVQALTFHSLRWWGSAQSVLGLLAPKKPPKRLDMLLGVAMALLWPPSNPPYATHALVNETVAAARRRAPALAGFVNAVLRRFLREQDALVATAMQLPLARDNHPVWWAAMLRRDWPAGSAAGDSASAVGMSSAAEAWMAQSQQRPPMFLRVNARIGAGAAYAQRLRAQGIGAQAIADVGWAAQAVVLDKPMPVQALPGFEAGEVSVQDLSAQRAAPLLLGALAATAATVPSEPRAPLRLLDACAAPGGKTAHLLELLAQQREPAEVWALDQDAARLQRVQDTLRRLKLPGAITRCADAADTAAWWDGRQFDAVLLDAPCSASGIVRRHPDIRWLRRESDVAALAGQQLRLVQALMPLLRPGGVLLYATCSVFKAEGQAVIDAFLQRPPACGARPWPGAPGHLLPLEHNPSQAEAGAPTPLGDGFFYALLQRPPP
jgi:16S rRNA (cytosine967-C5)-methyltransferase